MDTYSGLEYLGLNKIKRGWNGWITASCPFDHLHKNGDQNPSFGMTDCKDIKDASYNCFSCGSKGTFKGLIWHLSNEDSDRYRSMLKTFGADLFLDQVEYSYGNKSSKVKLHIYSMDEFEKLHDDINQCPEALKYLELRGISQEAIDLLELRYNKRQKRIIFPIMDSENLYAWSGRSILSKEEEPIYVKDSKGIKKEYLLAGEHLVQDQPLTKPILFVEGLTGLACLISNYALEKFIPMANLSASYMVEKVPKLLSFNRSIFILFDKDKAGEQLSQQWAEELSKHTPVFIYDWSKTDKDDVDFLDLDDLQLSNFNHFTRKN